MRWTDVPEEADSADGFDTLSGAQNVCRLIRDEDKSIRPKPDPKKNDAPPTHIFIEGDNYPALKLLEGEFSEKINFIYIDPPYNTGKNTFAYNDSRFLSEKSTGGEKDKYSAWLSFMSRRLTYAKKLLSKDGCIFIAIAEESLYVLKLLCDGIFGSENFINNFMWLHGKGKKNRFSRTMQESTLCYAKSIRHLNNFIDFAETNWAKTNADDDERGAWFSGSISFDEKRSNPKHPNFFKVTSPFGKEWLRQWLVTKEEMNDLMRQNKIYWGKAPLFDNVPRRKIFNGEKTKVIPKNIIDGVGSTRAAQQHLDALLAEKGSFDNPKPVDLIRHFLKIVNMKNDITVMDFFAGSGTTFEALVKQNEADNGRRRCILIQKPEEIKKGSKNLEGLNGSKGSKFKTISSLCYERIKRTIPPNDGLDYFVLSKN